MGLYESFWKFLLVYRNQLEIINLVIEIPEWIAKGNESHPYADKPKIEDIKTQGWVTNIPSRRKNKLSYPYRP